MLGIQRVLRGAGYESEIFVETADRRLESLTTDYREMVGAIAPDDILIHHFSIGSRASRTAYALPGRMALVYHNITPPEYFLGVHKDLVKLCFRGRRELTAYVARCDLALGDSEYNRQELEALGFAATGVLPVVPDFSHLDGRAEHDRRGRPFDDGWTNILFVGRVDPEQEVRGCHPRLSRLSHAAQSALAAAAGRLVQRLRDVLCDAARRSSRGSAYADVHFLGHVSNEELTAIYDVADLFLCASEHEGFCVPLVESFYKRVPVLAFAATAVPATMDGGGVLYTTKDPFEIARLMAAVLDDPDVEDGGAGVAGRCARRGCSRRTSPARCCDSSTNCARSARARPPRFRGTSGRSSIRRSGSRNCGSSGPALYRALPHGPEPGTRDAESGNSESMRDQHRKGERSWFVRNPRTASRIPAMIIHQWVPAAHRGDAVGDSARQIRDVLRRMGHESELFALTIDDDLRDDVRSFADPAARRGDVTIFHFALPSPMTAAFERLAGVKILQYHNITPAGVLRAVRSRAVPARGARPPRARDARRARRPRARSL